MSRGIKIEKTLFAFDALGNRASIVPPVHGNKFTFILSNSVGVEVSRYSCSQTEAIGCLIAFFVVSSERLGDSVNG